MAQQAAKLEKVPLGELVEDYHLYPRSEVDQATVEEFREALRAGAKFPPLRVCSKSLRIIDGFHRKIAYERERATHALCSLEDLKDDTHLFREAARANAQHGRRYSVDDYATGIRLAKRLGLTQEQISEDFLLPPERIHKLERLSAGRGQAPLERNVPKPARRSKLVDKSMDTISQITWTSSLLRCIREGHINPVSQELRRNLEELSVELAEYLSRTAPPETSQAPGRAQCARLYPPDGQAVRAA